MKHEYIVDCELHKGASKIGWANLPISIESDGPPGADKFMAAVKEFAWRQSGCEPDVRIVAVFKL